MEVSTEKPLNDTKISPNLVPIPTIENKMVVENNNLTTKRVVELLVSGTLKDRVCRSCLKVTALLTGLSQVLEVANDGALYKVSVRDMIQSFYPYVITEDSELPNKICNKCLDRTINLYLFNLQYKQSEQALRICLNEVNDSVTLLDPLDRPKLGRQKINVNHNVVKVTYKYVKHYAQPLIQLSKKGELIGEKTESLNKYECPKCWEVLPSLSSFVSHEKTHAKDIWFKCRFCGLSFSRKISYRRHIRNHETNNLSNKTESVTNTRSEMRDAKFECKNCATISDSYITHLQHIETHKFQKVLDNLLNKRAGDLCTVCLDGGKDMVSVDKTVALHGGCEELMGDQTVDNILAASFPDQPSKHYKYQELFIASPAKIIKINPRKSRKNKNSINKNDNENKSDKENKPSEKFRFTEPSKFITEIKFTENPPVVFEFSKPIDPFMEENNIYYQEQINDMNVKSVDIESPKQVEIIEKIAFADNVIETVATAFEVKECKYCWLFAKSAKCDICKEINKIVDETNPKNNNSVDLKKQTVEETKIIDTDSEANVEDEKWHCNVCLTINDAVSKMCFCCEAEKSVMNVHKKTKVFLERHNTGIFEYDVKSNSDGNNQNYKDISQDKRSSTKNYENSIELNKTNLAKIIEDFIEKEHNGDVPQNDDTQITNYPVTKVFADDKILGDDDITITKYRETKELLEGNSLNFKYISEDKDTSETMDICEEETQVNEIYPIQYITQDIIESFKPIEEMSVDQYEVKEHRDTRNDNVINVVQNIQPFQFNTGALNSKERRIKKPIRRVTSHK